MKPPRNHILLGDATERLPALTAASIDMVLTSPPYYQLRDYGVSGQLGLEQAVGDWVDNLRATSRELARVLLPTGSLWLNLGDSYAVHPRQGAPRKSLLLAPERLTLALLADGWLLRNKVIWAKTNPMPTSMTDRLATTHEYLYVFVRQPRYFFDLDAIRAPHVSQPRKAPRSGVTERGREAWRAGNSGSAPTGLDQLKGVGRVGHPLGKNPGDVWGIASSNYRGDHHATFPVELANRSIRAGCPEQRCTVCLLPWRRQLIRALGGTATRGTLSPSCDCQAASEPGLVLDPFFGAGTTGLAAEQLGRDWLGVELNPAYVGLATERIQDARAGPTSRAA